MFIVMCIHNFLHSFSGHKINKLLHKPEYRPVVVFWVAPSEQLPFSLLGCRSLPWMKRVPKRMVLFRPSTAERRGGRRIGVRGVATPAVRAFEPSGNT